jgi:transcription antitermination factor NusG
MMEDIFGQPKKIRPTQKFRLGETVQIIGGAFTNFRGKIEGINKNKALLLVRVEISGRTEPIKIKFLDAENV